MSPQQLTAEQLAQAGIGAYRPYLDAAGQGIAQGQNLAQTGARGVAGINASTDFAAAQRALQTGVGQAGQVGAYAQAAGAGMPTVAQGTQAVGSAIQQAPQFMQADLGRSQQMLGAAAQQTQGVQPNFGQATGTIQQGLGTGQQAIGMAAQAPGMAGFGQGIGAGYTAAQQAQLASQQPGFQQATGAFGQAQQAALGAGPSDFRASQAALGQAGSVARGATQTAQQAAAQPGFGQVYKPP